MRVLLAPDLPDGLVVVRSKRDERVLVVVAGGLSRSDVRGLSRLLLPQPERDRFACALKGR